MSGPSNISGKFSSGGDNDRASEHAELFTSKTRHKQRSSNRSTIQNGSNCQVEGAPESKLSPMSKKVIRFDKYSRKGGRWSWKRPSFERDVVSLVKAERKMEEDIAASLTEVEAVEAGLRYFDELLVPQSAKWKSSPSCVEREECRPGHPSLERCLHKPSPELQTDKSGQQGERFPNQSPGGTKRSLLGARGGQRNEGKAARSVGLKLTLRQRLENYDRQRGINTHQSSDGDPAPLALPPNDKKESMNASKPGCRSTQPRYDKIYGSITGNDALENPAPYEGGTLDRVGVQNILARSLGNAMMAVRGASKGGYSTRGRHGPRDGGERPGNDRSTARLRWRSWQEPPPFVLASARKMKERAHKPGVQGSDRKSEDAASRSRGEETERSKKLIASSNASTDGYTRDVLTPKDQGMLALPSASDVVLTDSTTNRTAPQSASESSSSGKASRRGVTLLVPRVATLAADIISTRKKLAEEDSRSLAKARRTKDFDPDKLDCVRRHEASIADRERRVQRLRTKAEQRSRFRARPLPSFLLGEGNGGVGGGMDSGEYIPSWIDKVGADQGLLLTALKQDHEAQELVRNTNKMNPHKGFASIILSSKSPPSIATALTNHGLRHAASRGPTTSTRCHPDFSKAVRGKRADNDSKLGSLHHPMHQQENVTTRSSHDEEGRNLITLERTHAGDGTAEPDVSRLTTLGMITRNRRVDGTPRSLMGRMLGSGMLERQREWANERMWKILELRRKKKEVKEQEVKGKIFEADIGARSWTNAKMKHLSALERHKAEEETREQLREARLRASAARARRDREAAEKAAFALAAKLGEAERAVARESRTAPTSKEESRKSRKPVSPPRRSKSQTDDGAVSKATAFPEEVGLRRSHRRRRILLSCRAAPDASLVENLSEDDFYRVAVEKIIEKSGESAGDAKQGVIEDNTTNETLATPGALLCHEDHSPGRRKARDVVPIKGVPYYRAGRFAQRSVRHGHDSKSIPAYKPSAPVRLSVERNTIDRRPRRRRAPDALGPAVEQMAKIYSVAGLVPRRGDGNASYTLPLSGSRQVGPNSSILSLFEAQSVEHCTDTGSVRSGRESYLECSTVEGNEPLGNRSGPRKENTDSAFTSVRGRELYRSPPPVTAVHGVALGEYPWSEETMSRSPGSGTAADSQTELNCVSSDGMNEAPDGESRGNAAEVDTWERCLRSTKDELIQYPIALLANDNKGQEEDSGISGGVGPRRPRGGDEFKSDFAKMRQSTTNTAAIVADEGCFFDVVRVNGSDSGDHSRLKPSSFDNGPDAVERKKLTNKDGTKTTAQRLDDDIVDRREGDQLSPEASSTNDLRGCTSPDQTTVAVPFTRLITASRQPAERAAIRATTLVGLDEGQRVLRKISDSFAPQGSELGASERKTDDLETSRSIRRVCNVDDERSSSASSLIGRLGQSFFDPTTSSADKGRFRVRDPRRFDPCSMRRAPDFVTMKSETADNEVVGSLVGANDSCSVTEGVTLLKGRRIPGKVDGRREIERDGQEEVITVMFDRSKFNEHEAKSWWSLNCARIMGDSTRGSCVPHVVHY